jgi:hypothetical protein
MLSPQVLSEFVIAAISLTIDLALGTTGDMTEVLDVVYAMDRSEMASKICLAPES